VLDRYKVVLKVKAPNKLLSRAYNRHREPCIATVAGDCLCLTRLRLFISVYTIWVKKGAEARSSAFYFTELAVPLVYIFIPRPCQSRYYSSGRRLPSRFTTPLCLLFLGSSNCAARISFASFPWCHSSYLDPQRPKRPQTSPVIGSYYPVQQALAPMATAEMTSTMQMARLLHP